MLRNHTVIQIILYFTAFCYTACSSCHSDSLSQNKKKEETRQLDYDNEEDEDEKEVCTKVGQQCPLRPGVLGVCLPGGPTSTKRLICTPQH